MKILILITSFAFLFSLDVLAKIKHQKLVKVQVHGNCEMCQSRIQKAGTKGNLYKTHYNVERQEATIVFDSTAVSQDVILKQIALAGYDNASYLAPESAYNKLPGCCKYERKKGAKDYAENTVKIDTVENRGKASPNGKINNGKVGAFSTIYLAYFNLKDALVKSDKDDAKDKSTRLLAALSDINMEALTPDDHVIWMEVVGPLKEKTTAIVNASVIDQQRGAFATLSNEMYKLMKQSKNVKTVYYQYCPMYNDGKGASWLSLENGIKNPFYGSAMLTCGKTKEIMK